jgi:hypothetical protein
MFVCHDNLLLLLLSISGFRLADRTEEFAHIQWAYMSSFRAANAFADLIAANPAYFHRRIITLCRMFINSLTVLSEFSKKTIYA